MNEVLFFWRSYTKGVIPLDDIIYVKVIERNIEQAKNERLLKTERSEENY